MQRLRHQLRGYFPAALEACDDLDAPDTLELLDKDPDPGRAAKLTRAQVSALLKRSPPQHPGQGHRHPGSPARRAARPAAGARRRPRWPATSALRLPSC